MHTFFHGWRRKAGVATLVMGLALMALWIRSTLIGDRFSINGYVGVSQLGIVSLGLQPELAALRLPPQVTSESLYSKITMTLPNGNIATSENPRLRHIGVEIPIWVIVIPLSLLSACLLLIPSRKRPQTPSQSHA